MTVDVAKVFRKGNGEEITILIRGDELVRIRATIAGTDKIVLELRCSESGWDGFVWQIVNVHMPVDFVLLYRLMNYINAIGEAKAQDIAWNN